MSYNSYTIVPHNSCTSLSNLSLLKKVTLEQCPATIPLIVLQNARKQDYMQFCRIMLIYYTCKKKQIAKQKNR